MQSQECASDRGLRGRQGRATRFLPDAALLLVLLAAQSAYLFWAVPDYLATAHGGDYPFYVQIAEAPLANAVPSPWRYRLLNPLAGGVFTSAGVTTNAAFFAVSFTFAFGSCLLMQWFLRLLSLSDFAARAGAAMFAVSVGGYVPLRRYYGYPDAMTNFFILALLIGAALGHRRLVAAAFGIGAVAKESMLLLVPFMMARMRASGIPWTSVAAVVSVPVAVFLLLRLIIGQTDASVGAPVALTLQAQLGYWQTAMVHGPVRWILWSFAYSMGPLWLLAAVAVPRARSFVRQMLLYLLPIAAPLTRTTDTERALMLTFPVVFALAALALDECRGGRRGIVVATLAATCVLASQLTYDWSEPESFGVLNAKDLVFAGLCVLPAAAAIWARTGRRAPGPPARLEWPDVTVSRGAAIEQT